MDNERDWNAERAVIDASAAGRERLIIESFACVTGGVLMLDADDAAGALWTLPAAVVAHGMEDDPVFFYANRAALDLFEVPAADFVRLPSRLSAGEADRAARAHFMERVTADGFVHGYSAIRVAASGRRFRIEDATVWNLLDDAGACRGQAACFARWTPVD
jgi:PAS domain-containing protein